ncbi:MAG: T9SS type A sorting domain-containing protein [Reichenbachiella sp.]
MIKSCLIFFSFITVLPLLVTAQTNTSTGAGNWSTGGNWSLGVPTAAHDVVINTNIDLDTDGVANSVTINTGFTLDLLTGNTLDISDGVTNVNYNVVLISGTLDVNGGTLNIADGILTDVSEDIVIINNNGIFNINDGTVNISNNAGFTDGTAFRDQAIVLGGTTSNLNIGDGDITISATLEIATFLTSQSPVVNEWLIQQNSDDGQIVVNVDGDLQVGGGNIGSIWLNDDDGSTDEDFHMSVQGGTVDVAGRLRIGEGAGFQMTNGTMNVGISSSGGTNDIDFNRNDPTSPALFSVTGGTFSVGDGSMNINIGDDDGTPTFGTIDQFHEFEVTGGTVNINGRLRLRDQNARLSLGGGTINFNPQGINNLDESQDVLFLNNGIVLITGATNINFLNPHASSGTGTVIEIQGQGTGNNGITGSTTISSPIDFSNITWGFGDGSESSSSVDGFDLLMVAGHTSYGNFVVNNPSGTGRDVVFTNASTSYLTENITITAGALDVGTNNLDDDGSGSTFLIDANGTLKMDTDFPGTSTANYATYTLNTGSTVELNGTTAVSNVQVPDGTDIYNLTVSGTGIKTINAATNVNGTLSLSDGTLATGTNMTIGSDATITRSAGVMTGDIVGTANYTIEYTGLSKSIDDTSDPEWTGGGTFDLIINLDANETLTLTGSQISVDDLTVLEGILTDASGGFTHTVAGDLTMNTSFTGSGTISITGGTATHNLTTSGTAIFSNLTMNDASYDASGDLDMNITGTLTLTAGDIQVTSGTFTMSNGATISGGSATSYIAFDGSSAAGGLKQTYNSSTDSKTYPIGTNTEYTEGTIALDGASGFGELTMVPVASGSAFTLDGLNTFDIDFHWLVTTDGSFTSVQADHTYTYDDTDVRGVEGSYIAARYNITSPEWTTSDDTSDGSDGVASNVITLTNVDFIDGHFTAGEEDEFAGVITTYYTIAGVGEPLDWNNGAHWTNTDGGTTPINKTPGTNSPVVVNRIVNIDDDNQSAGSITIEAAGVVILGENGSGVPSSGHTFGTVSGTGTLRVISDDTDNPTFPDENGGNWSNFLGAFGGTVEYSGDGSYTLPSDVSSYYNLSITSSASCSCTKSMGDVDLMIYNDLSISSGNTMTTDINDGANGDITIAGNLTIAANNTLGFGNTNDRTVAVAGNVTNSGTFNVSGSGTAGHNLSIGGALSSDGTMDMNTGGSTVDVTFNGTTNESISGSGSIDFNRLIVNKGTSQTATLTVSTVTMTITDTGSDLSETSIDLQNGTLIISVGGTYTANTNGDWTIPSTAKLYLNSSTAVAVQMTTLNAGTLFLNGSLQVSTNGIITIGDQTDNTTDNSILYDGSAEIIVSGGTLNVGGAVKPNVTDASAELDFTLSSGTVSIARNTSTNNINANSDATISDGDFVLDNPASSFNMTGGTLEIVRAESSDGKAISISNVVDTYSVTGGTVEIMRDAGDAFSSNSLIAGNDIAIYSNVPIWNLLIGDGDFPGDVGGPNTDVAFTLDLVVFNDLTINLDNSTGGEGNFDMFRVNQGTGGTDPMDMFVGGSFTITDGTFEVLDNGTGGTITFNGSGLAGQSSPQVITSNGETLGDIVINNSSGSVDLGDALTISGDWTHTTGTFNNSTFLVTITNSVPDDVGNVITGNATFEDITLSNTNGVNLTGGDLTIISGGVLTLSTGVILDIGDNGLIISDQTAAGLTVAAASATNMVKVSGNLSARGITRTYPDAITLGFIYPIGATINATDYYLPAQIDLTAGGGAGSTATVTLVTAQHPQTVAGQNALNVYWKVTETGFDDTQTVDHDYTYGSTAADIVEGGDDTGFRDAMYTGDFDTPNYTWIENIGSIGSQVVSISDPGTDNIVGEFSAGVDAAFDAVTVYYSMRDGNWNNIGAGTTPWTLDDCLNGSPTEELSQPGANDPVIVCGLDEVTITTTTGLLASSVEIETTGQLTSQVADISTIGAIDGAGTLQFAHTTTTTPIIADLTSDFIGISGGTINYGGTAAYTLPTNSTYNNLTISNTNTVTLGADVTVNGDVTLTGANGTVDMGGFTLSDADNGGTFTLGSSTTLEVDGEANFPDNFGTYTLNSASTVDYTLASTAVQTLVGGITYGNLTLTRTAGSPAQRSLTTDITIVGDLTIGSETELVSNSHTITLQGDWTRDFTGTSNFEEGTGTVLLSGGANQTIDMSGGAASETFYNLTINKSGGTTVDFGANINGMTISNDLVITAETLDMGTIPLTVSGNASTAASGIFNGSSAPDFNGNLTNAGTFAVPTNVYLAGDFSNTGTYTITSNTLVFDNVTTAQNLNGNATTFNNITVAKATGIDLTFNVATTVNNNLSLQNEGNLVLATGNLTIPVGASITGNAGGSTASDFSSNRMIRTNGGGSDPFLVKNADTDTDWDFVFPIGVDDSGNKYTPVTVDATTDNITGGTMSVRSINGTGTDETISGSATTLNRHFDLDITGTFGGSMTFDFIFQYDNGDVQGTEGDYLSAYSTGSGWTQPIASMANTDAGANQFGASASLDGTISIGAAFSSEWMPGDLDLLYPRLYPYTSGGGDWNTATDWSQSIDGSTSDGPVPTANNAVTILAGETMTMDNNGNSAASIEVLGSLDIAATTGHSLGELTGTGTLQIDQSALDTYVDTGSGSTFFDDGGGTVEYGGASSYTLPTAITEYNNLSILDGTQDADDKELGANILVHGDLNLNTVDLENTGNFELELRGSFASAGVGNFELNDGTFVWSNTAASSLSSDIIFGSASSLVLDNFGTKTLAGAMNINDITINSSSGTFDANSDNITLTGDWDNQSVSNVLSNPGTTTFNGGAAQQIDGINTFGVTNISTASTAVTVNTGVQSFTGALTLATNTSLDIGSNEIRVGNTLDVDAGTFTASSGTVVYTSSTDPETQIDPITVGTLEIDKGTNNTLDNDPGTISFTNLVITSGEYDGDGSAIPGFLRLNANAEIDLLGITSLDINTDVENYSTLDLTNGGLVTDLFIGGNYADYGSLTLPATVTFDGAGSQTLNTPLTVTNFVKDGGGDLTLNSDLTINSSLTLTDGNINSDETNTLIMSAGAGNPVGSASSMVNNYMLRYVNTTSPTTLDFPLGDGTNYRPMQLLVTQADPSLTFYLAGLIDGPPTSRTLPGAITNFSNIRYYDIQQVPANSLTAGTITINYGADDVVTTIADLRILKSNGTVFDDLGGTGTAAPVGSITSTNNFTDFSDFVLASENFSNPLPIDLISFEGQLVPNGVSLIWETASEINNDFFQVERSIDGKHFKTIGSVDGNGNSNGLIEYNYLDSRPYHGISYYRLVQYDYDGEFEIFDPIRIDNTNQETDFSFSFYPNPTQSNNLNFRLSTGNETSLIQITMYNLSGKVVHLENFAPVFGNSDYKIHIQGLLKKGIYQAVIQQGNNQVTSKISLN